MSFILASRHLLFDYVHDLNGNIIAEYNAYIANQGHKYIWYDERPVAAVDDAGTANPELLFVHTDHPGRPISMSDNCT